MTVVASIKMYQPSYLQRHFFILTLSNAVKRVQNAALWGVVCSCYKSTQRQDQWF
mgnify:CR=1 FL=1